MEGTSTKIADAPFDDLAGDIILRSSGEKPVDFHTYKLFLIHASSVFKNMFSLPENDATIQNPGPPVVNMHENADDLRTLLTWCHPAIVPERPTTIERFYCFYVIADKYMLDSVKVWLRKCLADLVTDWPVGVYVLARHLGWQEEAKLAAKASLSRELYQLVAESHIALRDMPGRFLQDLLQYHHRCSTFLSSHMDPERQIYGWVEYEPGDEEVGSFLAEKEDCCPTEAHHVEGNYYHYSRAWWATFASDCSASLAKIPSFEKIPLQELLYKATEIARKCPSCGPAAHRKLENFFFEAKKELLYMQTDHVRFQSVISPSEAYICVVSRTFG